jgi:tetratricopeptide (TPR) repeat protein
LSKRVNLKSALFFVGIFILILSSSFNLSARELPSTINEALANGDTTTAINLLKSEIVLDRTNYRFIHTLGEIYYNQGNYQDAILQFNEALSKKRSYYVSLFYKGMSYLKMGDLDKAEEAFDRGREKDRKEGHRFEDGYGQVMMLKKNYLEADRAFRQALVGQPDNPTYHIHLGDANFYQGIPSLAVMEYQIALEVDTAGLEVYYHWAEACLEMKDYACAIEKLKIVLQKDSTHAPSWMRAGGIYFKAAMSSRSREDRSSRFKDVIGAYKKYIELSGAQPDSNNVRVYFELAMSYNNLNGFEDAVEQFENVLSIPFEARDIYFHYGKALWGVRDYEKSGETLQKHIEWVAKNSNNVETKVKDYELYQVMGDSYYYRQPKDNYTAIEHYKKSLADRPGQKRIIQNIAIAYHSLKDYGSAIEYYNKRIELGMNAKSASILKNAGYCALNIANQSSSGDEDEELEDELDEESIDASHASATIDPNLNYYEVAVGFFGRYLEHVQDDVKVLDAIARTYLYNLNDCTNGVKYYEMVLSVDPNNCDAKKSIGFAYFGGVCTKNYSKALRYLREAESCLSSSSGGCSDVDLLLWIAQCYHLRAADKYSRKENANDDFKAAYNWYGRVLKCQPNHSDAKKGQNDTRFEFGE